MRGRHLLLVLLAAVAGCGRNPPPPASTGAAEAAQGWFDALRRQDWARAYDNLHPDSRARHSRQTFSRLGTDYLRRVGFEPEAVHVTACEEHGDEATAHVVLTGRRAGKQQRYKDAVVLRRTAEGWRVALPQDFSR